MGRRPRLPAVLVYLFVAILLLLIYRLVFNEKGSTGGELPPPQINRENVGTTVGAPERRRKIIRPSNPHDYHLMINNPRLCADVSQVISTIFYL